MRYTAAAIRTVVATAGAALLAAPAWAHAGSLSGTLQSAPVPSWLVVITGGGIIGASFLFTSLVTDHAAIRAINAWRASLPTPGSARDAARGAGRGLGLVVLVGAVVVGAIGPPQAAANLAVLVVWAGWWAGYTMTVYLVGNTWPAFNPWRTIAEFLSRPEPRDLPAGTARWLSVAGLLALIWIEVISPVARDPRLLAAVVVGYSAATLAGAAAYGPATWFGRVDPIARVFGYYGRLAPLQRTDAGVEITLPTTALAEPERPDIDVAFVIALLWVTTYDGLVSTPAWAAFARAVVGIGVPPRLLYLVVIVAGFVAFLGAYRLASRAARRTADTYVTTDYIARWFAPSLLPIAAGYHLAHFLGYFISLSPALVAAAATPLSSPASITVVTLPGWFGGLQLGFVVAGHLFAVWVAHSLSFELFPGRLEPVRSQYPFVIVMIGYTVTSMWIVSRPFVSPPFV